MPKTTQELAASKGGSTTETNGMGSSERGFRPDGVYQLKDDEGKVVSQIIVKNHPLFGDAQAAAVERVGFKFLREATAEEHRSSLVVGPTKQETDKADDIKGILARLDAAEKRNEELEAKLAAIGEGGDGDENDTATGNSALDDAEDDDEEEKGGEDETPSTPEKPLTKDNYNEAELRAIAEAEGVELTDEHSTKQKIVDAIVAAREAKKGE